MWTREMLKTEAKKFLKGNYWKAFLVSLLLMFVGGGSSGGSSSGSSGGNGSRFATEVNFEGGRTFMEFIADSTPFGFLFGLGFVIIVVLVIGSIAFRIFLGYPLEVGGRKFFIRGAEEDVDFAHITSTFNGQYYMNIVISMLYRAVINFLFYLLLIIPGIIKSYAYSMVPYILSDNPEIDHKRALELSTQMTDGHKWDMFVLDLSFIGWYLLGMLAFGFGVLFVNPYVDATKAQLYLTLRKTAVSASFCSASELNLDVSILNEDEDDWYNY